MQKNQWSNQEPIQGVNIFATGHLPLICSLLTHPSCPLSQLFPYFVPPSFSPIPSLLSSSCGWASLPVAAYVDQIFQRSSGLTGRELFTGLFRQGEDQWVYTLHQKREAVSHETRIYVPLNILVRTQK